MSWKDKLQATRLRAEGERVLFITTADRLGTVDGEYEISLQTLEVMKSFHEHVLESLQSLNNDEEEE